MLSRWGTDRHVPPADPHAQPQVRHIERAKLLLLDQRDDGHRAPIPDGIEVDAEVAPPPAGHRVRLMFAGTEGDADPALPLLCLDLGNHQWVSEAGAHWG